MNEERCLRLIHRAIDVFELEVRGLNVLTEAASGPFVVTPMIAALAGADRVIALTRDSRYGSALDVTARTCALADRWGVSDRIDVITDRHDPRVMQSDVVTNSGHVRPIDASFLEALKPSVAVPLMYETWEHRPADLDLAACRDRDVPVLGTDESHPALRTMQYVGELAMKLLHEVDVELCASTVVVVGAGPFADAAERVLEAAGARVTCVSIERLREIGEDVAAGTDALVVAEHVEPDLIAGRGGVLDPAALRRANPGLVVAHIAGAVDAEALSMNAICCHPAHPAPAGYMSVTTAYLGPRPMIDLYTAGLSIGAALTRARARGLSRRAAERHVLRTCPFAQDFPADYALAHGPSTNRALGPGPSTKLVHAQGPSTKHVHAQGPSTKHTPGQGRATEQPHAQDLATEHPVAHPQS